jgi:hypothetical protein
MKTKVRNHLASLCMKYTKDRHQEDFLRLVELAEHNYASGKPLLTLDSVFREFLSKKEPKVMFN